MDLTSLSAHEISRAVSQRDVSIREVVDAHLARIDAVEPAVRAMLRVLPVQARAEAVAADQRLATGDPPRALEGVPVILKDNLCTQGIETTCGSRILEGFVPPFDATVVARMRAAGAIVLGKANLDEFAMGSSTENSAFGPSRNPWDTDRVPGGSSGGSAAAVAAREAPVALGSDTGGSIRQPAALCGVVGLKPTYGRVSRYGLVAYASSLDQIGPITRSVADAALVLGVIAGVDARDSTCVDTPVAEFDPEAPPDLTGLRIGVPVDYFAEGVEPDVAQAVRAAIGHLCALGAAAEECSLPTTDYGLAAYYIIAPAEASSNLARYDGVKYGYRADSYRDHIGLTERTRAEGFGSEVKQRIMVGTYALSAGYYDAYYRRAQQIRTLIRRDFDRAFERYDLLATPTSPTVAFRLGERSEDPLAMKLADVCTLPANLAGLPGISLPCGFAEGLPIGLQLLARPFDEAVLLRTAQAYQQSTDWLRQEPSL